MRLTREFLKSRMQNFQVLFFVWIRTYREIFKSTLVYLKEYISNSYETESAKNMSCTLKVMRRNNLNRFIFCYTNINFTRNKFDMLASVVCIWQNQKTFLRMYFKKKQFKKAHTQTPHILPHRPNINITPFHTKKFF